MKVEIAPNPPNDFYETVASYPFDINELIKLGFPPTAVDWARNFHAKAQLLLKDITRFVDIKDFVERQIRAKKIALIKIDDGDRPLWDSQAANYYINFGGHPSKVYETINFRIDQDFQNYKLPSFLPHQTKFSLTHDLPYLSGLVISGSYFHPVLSEKFFLLNSSRLRGFTQFTSETHFLIAHNYWGVNTFIDNLGQIVQSFMYNGSENIQEFEKIRDLGITYEQWIVAELRDPFRPINPGFS